MIVPMKRVYLLILKEEKEKAITKLREAGVYHIEQTPAGSESLTDIETELDKVNAVLDSLKSFDKSHKLSLPKTMEEGKVKEELKRAYDLVERQEKDTNNISEWKKEIVRITPWGDFDPEDIAFLSENGVAIELVKVDKQKFDVAATDGNVFVVGAEKKKYLLACVNTSIKDKIEEVETFPLPVESLGKLLSNIKEAQTSMEMIEEKLRSFIYMRGHLELYRNNLLSNHDFESVKSGLEYNEDLVTMSGFVPATDMHIIEDYARLNSWGLAHRDPLEEEVPPTKLKQNFFARLITPVLDFLEVVPGYREVDCSLPFFSFFCIFFAMIMGDAAYGIFIFVMAFTYQIVTRKASLFIKMLYPLSICTIIWGTLSGSWFGSEYLAAIPSLKNVTLWQLSNFPELLFGEDPIEQRNTIMLICFTLGLFHLSIGRLWRFAREFPKLSSYFNLTMVALIVGLYYVILFMIQIIPEPPVFMVPLLVIGGSGMFLFGQQEPGVSFLKGLGRGFANSFNNFLDTVSVFSDLMSYIRLFAVGVASFSIASSFNGMAAGAFEGGGFFVVFGVLLLVIGHVINFVLACLSVVVHAVRLNLLEFSNHLGIEWAGIKYTPFKSRGNQD